MTTALVADDEEGPREQLVQALRAAWPELEHVHVCQNGTDAWDTFLAEEPDVCFLDIRMPGMSGLEVAQRIDGQAPIVLVTAHSEHALAAFEAGALDYIVKPVDAAKLARAVNRVRQRLSQGESAPSTSASPDLAGALQALSEAGLVPRRQPFLTRVQASLGREVRMVRLEDVVYFESDTRYTRVVWQEEGRTSDALLRMPLKELLPRLDPEAFWQVHRSVIVRCDRIASALRDGDGIMTVQLRGMPDRLPVSRQFQGLFKGQ